MDHERRVDVEWTGAQDIFTTTKLKVFCQDKPGLLRNLSECFSTNGVNISNAQIRTNKEGKALCYFDITVKSANQVSSVIQALQKLPDVLEVERVTLT